MMYPIKAPKNIPYYYNRASNNELENLRKTFDFFEIKNHHSLVGETLLRLGDSIKNSNICFLPTDAAGKALFHLYKYYANLEFCPVPVKTLCD